MNSTAELEWYEWYSRFSWWASRCHRGSKTALAKRLGVSRQRLHNWIQNGHQIPGWAVVVITNYMNPLAPLVDGSKPLKI